MSVDALLPVLLGSYMGLQGWILYALVSVKTEMVELKTTLNHIKRQKS